MSMAYYTPYIPQNMEWQDEYAVLAVDNLANPANQNKVIHLNNAGDLEFLEANVPNGFLKLDSEGNVPLDRMHPRVKIHRGVYDIINNLPPISDSTGGDSGDSYECSTAGTRDFGSGNITVSIGDYLVYSGTKWERSIHNGYNKTETDAKFLQIVNGVEKSGSTMTGDLTVPTLLCDTIGHGLNDNIIDLTGSDIVLNKNIDMTGFGIWQSAEINSLLAQFTTLSAGSFTCRNDIGTGAIDCKALTCTSINTTNGNLAMGTGDISCDAITTTGTITCKAINTQNSALTLGTGTITTTGATSTGALTCTTMSSMGGSSGTRYSGMFQNTDSNYGNACAISLALGASPINWTTPNVFGLRHAIYHSNSLGNMSYRVAIQRYNSPAPQDLQYTTMNANEVLSTTLRGNFTIDNDANIITPSCSLTVKNLGTGIVHSNSSGLLSSSSDITCTAINGQAVATWKRVKRNVNSFTGDGGSSAKTITLASGETATDILCTGGGTVIYPTITISGSPSVLSFTQTWTNGVAYVLSATSIA